MTYEQIMYEKVLAHTDCRNLKEILGHVEEESAIEITNYHDGENRSTLTELDNVCG